MSQPTIANGRVTDYPSVGAGSQGATVARIRAYAAAIEEIINKEGGSAALLASASAQVQTLVNRAGLTIT